MCPRWAKSASIAYSLLKVILTRIYQVCHLRLTIHCLADAGNMLDCSCLAGVVALRHFRRPEVEVVGDEVTIVREPSSHPASDTLTHLHAAPPL